MAEMQERWPIYDGYIAGLMAAEDEALEAARRRMAAEGLPDIAVSASEGKLLQVLARAVAARRILEVGTLGGYSAIWLARALPAGGRLISLELNPHHAEVARANVDGAGLGDVVEIRLGPAAQSLDQLAGEGVEPFDVVFIDADKDGYETYLAKSVPLLRPGGLLLADNTLPDSILTPEGDSGAKRYNTAVAAYPGLHSIIFPVLRDRGVDGLTVSVREEERG